MQIVGADAECKVTGYHKGSECDMSGRGGNVWSHCVDYMSSSLMAQPRHLSSLTEVVVVVHTRVHSTTYKQMSDKGSKIDSKSTYLQLESECGTRHLR